MFGKLKRNEDLNPSGIGLGLTICNKILNQLGGELQVSSKYEIGTTFYFKLNLPVIVKDGPNFSSAFSTRNLG
jgi:signal transduction histidine kinase